MGIGKYIVFSVVFLAAVGFFIINMVTGDYRIELYGISVNLPIVVWVLLPAIALFLASVLHLSAYSVGGFFKKRSLQRDYDTFVNGAVKKILGEQVSLKAKTTYFETPMKLLNSLENKPGEKIEIFNEEKIQKALNFAKEVRNGEYVDNKEFKISKESKLYGMNQANKLAKDSSYTSEILRNCTDKTSELCKSAFKSLCAVGQFKEIVRYGYEIKEAELLTLIDRMDDKFVIKDEDLLTLIQDAKLDSNGYINVAKKIKSNMQPDAAIAMFEKLYNTDIEVADEAYLYLLYDFQMLEKVKELLQNAGDNEYQKIRALIELKEAGKSYDIDMFM